MVAWEVIGFVKVDSKMQQKRWKNIINGMIDLDTNINCLGEIWWLLVNCSADQGLLFKVF